MYKQKIGVIVTVFNVEEYLRECIESIINQTYWNLDIILVDDGSSDNSGAICDEYKIRDARVQVVHQKNSGPLAARYAGLKKTKSEYITFVDGDDFLDLNAYKIVAEALNTELDIVSFGIIRYYNSKNQRKTVDSISKGMYLKNEIEEIVIPNMIWNINEKKYGLDPSLCTKVIKRELWESILDETRQLRIYYGQDIAVIYPLIRNANTLLILKEHLYYHRQRNAGILPSYIKDHEFLNKLYTLYSFLMMKFSDQKECIKQIEYFYSYAVNLRKQAYSDYSDNDRYLFPFWEIKKQSRVVLYGAGSVGQTYYYQLTRSSQYEIVAWIDKNYKDYHNAGVKKIESIDVLDFIEYDYIIIAVLSFQLAENVRRNLIDKGISENKIIWVEHR